MITCSPNFYKIVESFWISFLTLAKSGLRKIKEISLYLSRDNCFRGRKYNKWIDGPNYFKENLKHLNNQCITLKVQHHQAWLDLCYSVKNWNLLRIVTTRHMRQINKFSNVATISWNISFICSSSYGASSVVILVIWIMQDATEKFISDKCRLWG